jgi:elongation factor 1-beta
MGTVLIKIRLMPESPSVDLDKLKIEATKVIESKKGKNPRFEEEPIAFGLSALNVFFQLAESDPLDPIEEALGKMNNVNSAQVTDMRRAI